MRKVFILICSVGVIYSITALSGKNFKSDEVNYGVEISANLNSTAINQVADDCFDEFMEVWFEEFNGLQNKGFNSEKADNLASYEAIKVLKTCDS